jgi:hypothetical protein
VPIYWGARIDGEVYNRSGDAPWDGVTWGNFERNAAKQVSIVHFGQKMPWQAAFTKDPFDKCWASNAIPLCSMDYTTGTLKDLAAGKYDSAIKTWAGAVKSYGKAIMIRPLWEMNGDWFLWGKEAKANPTTYVNAWRRFYDLCKVAPNISWVWCPNTIYNGSTPLPSLFPGYDYIDWVGIDGYNWGSRKGIWSSFGMVFGPTYQQIKTITSKPMMICETGCTEIGGSKPFWISDMFAALPAYDKIRALVWFNWNIYEGGIRWDWQIESSDVSLMAFSRGISSGNYMASVPLPPLGSKVKVP